MLTKFDDHVLGIMWIVYNDRIDRMGPTCHISYQYRNDNYMINMFTECDHHSIVLSWDGFNDYNNCLDWEIPFYWGKLLWRTKD